MSPAALLRSAATAVLVSACTRSSAPTTPDLRATITEVARPDPARQPVVRVYVDRSSSTPGPGASMPITLTGSSAVYTAQGGTERRTDYRALRAGQVIEVWFVENTAETNPETRQARKVVIQQGAS